MGLPDPLVKAMARLKRVIKGVKREYARSNPSQRNRLPITPEVLHKIKAVWSTQASSFNNIMLWAVCCLCYFGFFRSGEVTVPSEVAYNSRAHLNVDDIAVDDITDSTVVSDNKSVKDRSIEKRG